jgi:hypothetical protein
MGKGFGEATRFTDGHAELDPGTGWEGWKPRGVANHPDADRPFRFSLEP